MATYKSIKYIIPVEAVEHTDSINALSDVDTVSTAPADGQILKWNNTNSKWYPGDVEESSFSTTQKAIFAFGLDEGYSETSIINLVSSSGVVASDVTSVGRGRNFPAAAGYGGDKAIFAFGRAGGLLSLSNLVSNVGVMASDTTGVGTARKELAAASYGGDKAIFGFGGIEDGNGSDYDEVNITNLVSNVGVMGSDQTGVGTAQYGSAAAGYGGDKAIFAFGGENMDADWPTQPTAINRINLVSNTGVVASDSTGAGTARSNLAAASYGGDKAIYGYGWNGYVGGYNMTNLVSNTGVVASDTTGVGTARRPGAAGYGGDKAIFGFGPDDDGNYGGNETSVTNLVSNTGVVSSDTAGVGTGRRRGIGAAGYSTTA
jgi:hypothetical protein